MSHSAETMKTRASTRGDCLAKFSKTSLDNQYSQSEQQINGTQFPTISENAQASVFLKQPLQHKIANSGYGCAVHGPR